MPHFDSDHDVEVFFSSMIWSIMAIAAPDQSCAPLFASLSVAASLSESTVFVLLSHASEFDEATTTSLPSPEATASSTVFGFGLSDSSTPLAHCVGFTSVPKLSTYSKRTVTPACCLVSLILSVTAETFEPSRFCGSVMFSVSVPSPSAKAHGVIHNAHISARTMQTSHFAACDTPMRGVPTTTPDFSSFNASNVIHSTIPTGSAKRRPARQ